ncbi:MAG: D-tyrosyl-tRNA(Tyr) deacylase [Methylovulum sp.]|jgi:D-tyrosyl-tRNA(Tyr) deacylase|nr:D-tyrosyl-tRNA(Tyr) deacylase [Methylovulum sp.]MCF8007493.1 D-tyrosyl-tRNA(Tyr) deacylase [Methylovulum sp.]
MITVIQRVNSGSVTVEQRLLGEIKQGIVALVAIEKHDTEKTAERLIERILNYRIFADANDKMNLSVRDIQGGLLLIPQFTLAANTAKGNRPSFTEGAPPEQGRALFSYLCIQAKQQHTPVACGQFGADMLVALINNGPVTFTLRA